MSRPHPHWIARSGAVLALGVALLVALAPPALAHGRGTDATNYASEIIDVPDLPDVSWRVYGGDELLWARNDGDEELMILGYEGEPYLRIGPDGVFENRRSPAVYMNQERYARAPLPAEADASAEPQWERVSGEPAYAWHDHRIHYMSPQEHPAIAADPGVEQVVPTHDPWVVPVQQGGRDHAVTGRLWWVPGPSPWPWLALALPLTLPALVGLRSKPVEAVDADGERVLRWSGLVRPAAVVLGLIVLVNVSHLADDLFAVPLPASVIAFAAAQTVLFLAVGAFGAVRAWQGGDGAFTALGVGAGAVLVGQGLLFLPVLSASQLASLLPDAAARLIVGVSIVQALPVGAVAVLGTRRLLPDEEEAAEPAGSAAPG